jgi:hypothetical protein
VSICPRHSVTDKQCGLLWRNKRDFGVTKITHGRAQTDSKKTSAMGEHNNPEKNNFLYEDS